MEFQELIRKALEVRQKAYAPYSDFMVGAALLCKDGRIFTGCNIENASYGATNCAERTAFFKAVSEGYREFTAIAIAGGRKEAQSLEYCAPCGICRQVMSEFCDSDAFLVILPRSEEDYKSYTLGQLLPLGFTSADIEKR
ncbi:cytidine deaminase [Blautia ammoniilytica]|uniref:Cytidine deaminase n=1 Tax=Blautia ammoniilytica TaxID=2981782 RepID=A0ABT2TQM6_9FIRM|nr:cytidine deaminase [Blautia ammoniilytica]MCU6764520.1 cytidine deaminase [Blautia ammoniilytica]SCH43878.1 Cytidine deaminase [uncultured Blautia sp.]